MADEAVVGAEGTVVDSGALESGESTEGATGVAADTGSVEEPDHYSVVVGGREKKVTLDELTKGYQRQSDYTRKTQELAREREAVSELQALRVALERDPRTTLVALAGALGVDLGTASQVAAAVTQGDADPLEILTSKVDSLHQTLTAQQQAALTAQQQAQAQEVLRSQIEREIAELKELHGDFPEKELLQYAVDRGVVDLGTAFRAWKFDLAEAARIAEVNKTVEAKRRAQVVSGGQNAAPGSIAPNAKPRMTVREAWLAAAASAQ